LPGRPRAGGEGKIDGGEAGAVYDRKKIVEGAILGADSSWVAEQKKTEAVGGFPSWS